MNDENDRPVMASTWPAASIGSRTSNPTFSVVTLDRSMPVAFAKIGHCAVALSSAGAPMILPSRSFGLAMPRLLRAITANGGRL